MWTFDDFIEELDGAQQKLDEDMSDNNGLTQVISLYALIGVDNAITMRIQASINNKKLIILIDYMKFKQFH